MTRSWTNVGLLACRRVRCVEKVSPLIRPKPSIAAAADLAVASNDKEFRATAHKYTEQTQMLNRRTVGDDDAALRRIGRAVDCLRAQTRRVQPQDQHVATEGCDTVRATPLTWPQQPTVQATGTVRDVSHSQEPVRPTRLAHEPLRLAYERPREFGSRVALRGRLTLLVVSRLLLLHPPRSPVCSPSCDGRVACSSSRLHAATSSKGSTMHKVPFTTVNCNIFLHATFSFAIVGLSPTISHHLPPSPTASHHLPHGHASQSQPASDAARPPEPAMVSGCSEDEGTRSVLREGWIRPVCEPQHSQNARYAAQAALRAWRREPRQLPPSEPG